MGGVVVQGRRVVGFAWASGPGGVACTGVTTQLE